MSTKTQPPHSSFFPRIGFRSASKGAPAPPPPPDDDDDDWFTPYNGPYEIPTDLQPPPPGERDSWGAVLSSAMQNEDVLPGPEYAQREGGQGIGEGRSGSIRRRNTHGRARAASGVSRLTMSSGMVDPQMQAHAPASPSARTPPRRSPPSSSQVGGVGESPMPLQRNQGSNALPSPPANPPNRLSLASFLTFGQSAKRLTLTRAAEDSPVDNDGSQPSTPATGSLRRRKSKRGRAIAAEPVTPDDDDYFNSYYSTLVSTPKADTRFTRSADPPDAPRSAPPTRSGHPYAYTPSTPPAPAPPLVSISASYKGKGVDRAFQYPRPPPANTLSPSGNAKPSMRSSILKAISTPNLRALAASPAGSKAAGSTASRPKQRWLSPETWCDALLFPRPRFAMRVDDGAEPTRIVSPPGSPIIAWAAKQGDADGGSTWTDERVTDAFTLSGRPSLSGSGPGRVLPKSRSAMNLSTIASEAGSSRSPPTATPMFLEPRAADGASGQRERPRSFAYDDLAIPSPVPSLAKVLEAAENLERERKAWKSQASTSFQNKFSRSMSRARSKSVGNARARLKEPQQSVGNIDFLAARTFLGSQAIAPRVHVRAAPSSAGSGSASTGTHSRKSTKSHAQSNSLSASSRSHARTHSRGESWGKSALRSAAGMCIPDAERLSPNPQEEPRTQFDSSLLRAGETKILRLEEQMMSERRKEDPSVLSPSAALAMTGGQPSQVLTVPSPTPSGLTVSVENGVAVGIALSSPPPSDDHSEQISMPRHPYAQGGFSGSSYTPHHEHQRSTATTSTQYRGSDYAGPHPSSPHITMQPVANDVASRHRLPPHAILHPYAQASHAYQSGLFEQNESQPDLAAEAVPASAAHLQVGGRAGHAYAAGNRYSGGSLGLDDALAYALRRVGSVDSGLGVSEDHASPTNLNALSLATPPPARPSAAHASSSGNTQQTNHTLASTPPNRLNPPFFRHPSSTAATAGTSPPSRSESPQPSVHAFSMSEDLDRYRDLFYKPGRAPSDGLKRASGVPVDVGSRSSRAGSGFTTLARQLTEELENMPFEGPADGDADAQMWGRRYGGLRGERPAESAPNPNVVLAVAGQDDVVETTLPLRLHREASQQVPETPRISFPEDVESSRASSILERSPVEDMENDQVLRLGVVEAVLTPAAETADHRFSGHVSLVDEGVRDSEDTIRASDMVRPDRIISQTSSLGPPVPHTATDHTRSSYMTTSTNSRMSGLSDFPVPPDQLVATPAQVSLLNNYFGEVSQSQSPQPRAVLEPGDKPSPARSPYRTTFGSIGDLTQPR